MPAGKTTFNSSWLDAKDSNGDELKKKWCKKGSDNFTYTCLYHGPKELSCANMGKDALLQHATMEKHRKKAIASKSQCTLYFKKEIKEKVEQTKESGLACSIHYILREASLWAEIIWSLHTAYTNQSYRSCDGIWDTLVAMFPDSDIAKKMTLSKGKVSYIVSDGLGPVLLK